MTWIDFGVRIFCRALLGRHDRAEAPVAAAHDRTANQQTGSRRRSHVHHIGVPGGGVILKDGFSIRGMNTAATLWCTAAVGTLAGLGRFEFAAMGVPCVLTANLILHPVAFRINRTPVQKEEHDALYRFLCVCRSADETNIRTMLIQNVGRSPLTLIALHSLDDELLARVNVRAYVKTTGPNEKPWSKS